MPTDHPSNPPSQTKGQEIAQEWAKEWPWGTTGCFRALVASIDSALAAQEARHKAEMERVLGFLRSAGYRDKEIVSTCHLTAQNIENYRRAGLMYVEPGGGLGWVVRTFTPWLREMAEAEGRQDVTIPGSVRRAEEAESKLREATAENKALTDIAQHSFYELRMSGYAEDHPLIAMINAAIRSGPAQQAAHLREPRVVTERMRGTATTYLTSSPPPEQETPKPRASLLHDQPPCWCGRHRDSLSHSLGNFGGALFLHEYKPASAPPAHGGGD